MINPDVEVLRSLLRVDDDGNLIRLATTNPICAARFPVGSIAGSLKENGYVRVSIQNRLYWAHRVVWAIHTGAWPDHEIDHINGNPSDNRIENLRLATRLQNSANRGPVAGKAVGLLGVQWRKKEKKFYSQIRENGKRRSLGFFDTAEEAHAAYMAVARRLYGEFVRETAHGN